MRFRIWFVHESFYDDTYIHWQSNSEISFISRQHEHEIVALNVSYTLVDFVRRQRWQTTTNLPLPMTSYNASCRFHRYWQTLWSAPAVVWQQRPVGQSRWLLPDPAALSSWCPRRAVACHRPSFRDSQKCQNPSLMSSLLVVAVADRLTLTSFWCHIMTS